MSTKGRAVSALGLVFALCFPANLNFQQLKRIIFFLLRYSGLARLFGTLFQRNKVTILLFHDLDASVADKAFDSLQKHYHLIRLESFVSALRSDKKVQLPKNAMIITFDDGHIGNYDMLPSIIKHQVPATIYLCASIIDTHRHFWFQHQPIPMNVEALKRVPNEERLKILKEVGFDQRQSFSEPQALQQNHLSAMSDVIDFQAHTHFHPILPACSNEEANFEIEDGKLVLQERFGFNINSFAFPNGDYSERDIALVKRAGYTSALTVDFGFNDLVSDPYKLKRIPINDTMDINEIIVKASGLWAFVKTRNGRNQTCGQIPLISRS